MKDQNVKKTTAELAIVKGFITTRHQVFKQQKRYYVDARGEPTNESYFEVKPTFEDKPITQSLLQRWLRETFNIRVFPTQKVCGDFGIEIFEPNKENPAGKPFNRLGLFTKHFSTYEEALEYGLMETLNNL